MTRYNFREACLLDASGELSPQARAEFLNYIRENPAALLEYEEIRLQLDLLRSAPTVEISAHHLHQVPANLKRKLQAAALAAKAEKQAVRRRTLIRYALAGVASAAATVILVAALGWGSPALGIRERDQVAKINSTIDRLAAAPDSAVSPYDLAVTDVEASIRQLQTESPTLAGLHDKNMDRLLDALVTVPADVDDFTNAEPPPPPRSY